MKIIALICCLFAVAADKPTTKPVEFKSPLQVLQSVDKNLYPSDMNGWTDIRRAAVNDALKKTACDHKGTFSIQVNSASLSGDGNDRVYTLKSEPIAVGKFNVFIDFDFPADQGDLLGKVNPQDQITASGTISSAEIDPNTYWIFRIHVDGSHIVKK